MFVFILQILLVIHSSDNSLFLYVTCTAQYETEKVPVHGKPTVV